MPSPLCRCRTLYIGSAVPTVTKDGLQGIQEPLRERYPVNQSFDTRGIDSWLSVWSNGLLLEYANPNAAANNNNNEKQETTFFPIQSLHYCAAVRYVNVSGYEIEGGGEKFLPLDSPFAQLPNSNEPPIFAAILRRTTGIKVLECHAFICTNPKAANALVSCCFRAYADSVQLKIPENISGINGASAGDGGESKTLIIKNNKKNTQQQPAAIEDGSGGGPKAIKDKESSRSSSPKSDVNGYTAGGDDSNSDREIIRWSEATAAGKPSWQKRQQAGDYDAASISSSLAGRYRKKEKVLLTNSSTMGRPPPRARSELGGNRIPMIQNGAGQQPMMMNAGGQPMMMAGGTMVRQAYRRANSEMDLMLVGSGGGNATATMPRNGFGGGPPRGPMAIAIPQHHMMGGPPPPPPHMMPPHAMGGPPPPGMMGGPPPGAIMMAGPPPPHLHHPAMGPPPPQMMMGGPPGGMGPPPPPQMMMGGPPPPQMMGGPLPPQMMMNGGPGGPPSPYGMMGPQGPPGPPQSELYGTYRPKGGTLSRRAIEEPVYMPGSVSGGGGGQPIVVHPPEASYNPASYNPEEYEASNQTSGVYDTYNGAGGRRSQMTNQGTTRRRMRNGGGVAESVISSHVEPTQDRVDDPSYYWDSYEGGIYRKPHINERMFGTAMRQDPGFIHPSTNSRMLDGGGRPPTPPIDYDTPRQQQHHQQQQQHQTNNGRSYQMSSDPRGGGLVDEFGRFHINQHQQDESHPHLIDKKTAHDLASPGHSSLATPRHSQSPGHSPSKSKETAHDSASPHRSPQTLTGNGEVLNSLYRYY